MSHIVYPKFKLPDDLSVNTVTASAGISSSAGFYGDGSGLINLPEPTVDLSNYVTLTGVSSSFARLAAPSSSFVGHISASNISSSGVFYGDGSGLTNLPAARVIDVSDSSDALRITQKGSGNSLLVEDETNPDSTPFVINTHGRVGIRTIFPSASLDIRGSLANGNFGDLLFEHVGDYSHLEGQGTAAPGPYSHAEGLVSIASGSYSHAEGSSTTTRGSYSHAEGDNTEANGIGSHAEGYRTIATGAYQHVEGQFNAPNTTAIMMIGNGDSLLRKNIFEVYTSNIVVSGALNVTSNISSSGIFYGNGSGLTNLPSPSIAFSPLDISVTNFAPTAATDQYYYQTVAGATMTLSKMKVWGISGANTILVGVYRGTLSSSTLIGQGTVSAVIGANEITLIAEVGQNLNVTSGENLVVGIYVGGTSWRLAGYTGLSDVGLAVINGTNITTMPTTPTGAATTTRFACTLY